MTRRFLFLQGVASPFFSRLADWLRARGEAVYRVNFCAGDALYWRGKPAWNYVKPVEGFPEFLQTRCRDHGITDFILFGDQRPLHRAAIGVARRENIRIHAFEEGYVRPNWITLERGGNNAASALPRDPHWYLRANASLPDPGEGRRLVPSIGARALHDMAYHAANAGNAAAFRSYRTHRPFNAAIEYAGWARRFASFPARRRRDAELIAKLAAGRTPYFLLPLQLNGDVQIKHHSPFGNMDTVIEHVMRSFATHAPRGSRLLIKNHPLDTGLRNYPKLIGRLARNLDLAGRVDYVETGDLVTLLNHALGVVIVNSTVGLSAIQHLRPTKALGKAIYDLPGLTCQCALDDFWSDLRPPDLDLCRAFRNVVVHATQVNGGFYTDREISTAIDGCDRLLEPQARLDRLLKQIPPADALEHRQAV